MPIQNVISCDTEDCRGLMRLIGNASVGEVPLKLYYHCSECGAQATLEVKTGRRGGKFIPETLEHFVTLQILDGLGEPGPKYPKDFPNDGLNPTECPRCSSKTIEMQSEEPRGRIVLTSLTGHRSNAGEMATQTWRCFSCDYDWVGTGSWGPVDSHP